jgi:hypothetical protein
LGAAQQNTGSLPITARTPDRDIQAILKPIESSAATDIADLLVNEVPEGKIEMFSCVLRS